MYISSVGMETYTNASRQLLRSRPRCTLASTSGDFLVIGHEVIIKSCSALFISSVL